MEPTLEMHISFLCPACGKVVEAQATEAGKKCFCPHCSAEMLVPFIRLNGEDRQKALELLAAHSKNVNGTETAAPADRRDSTRWGTEGIWVHIDGKGPYRVVNLSSGGIAIELPVEETAQLGKLLTIEIDDPFQGGKVSVKAEVVWLTLLSAFDGSTPVGNGLVADRRFVRMGVAFRDVPHEDKEALDAIRHSISL